MNKLTDREIQGYKEVLDLIIEKRTFLEKELFKTNDSEKKSTLKKQIEELAKNAEIYKEKLNQDIKQAEANINTKGNNNLVFSGISHSNIDVDINSAKNVSSNLENELVELRKLIEEKNAEEQKERTKILFITSSPTGKNPLDFGEAYNAIKDTLKISKKRDDFDLDIETGVEASEVINKLTNQPYPDIVHFFMHSSKSKGLYFEKANKEAKTITVDEFKEIFELVNTIHKPKLVMITACNSIKHAEAITEFADHVVGTQDFLPDEIAVMYSKKFYEMYFDGKAADFAHKAASLTIKYADMPEEEKNRLQTPLHEIPVLLTNK